MNINGLQIIKFTFLLCILFSACNKPKETTNSVKLVDQVGTGSKSRLLGTLINGKKQGLWVTLDSLGQIESEQTFVDGREFGVLKLFENGRIVASSQDSIIGNDTVTTSLKYNYNGKIITISNYVNGNRQGKWIYYFNDGVRRKLELNYHKKKVDTIFKAPDFVDGVI